MSSPSLRTGSRSLQRSIRSNPSLRSATGAVQGQRPVHNLASVITTGQTGARNPARTAPPLHANSPLRTRMTGPSSTSTTQQLRAYSASSGSGSSSSSTPTADNLIEEIQDLYEIATDEFEIATDSTDGSTIYAASDRESARDALNQLVTVYELYTGSKVASTHSDSETQPNTQKGEDGEGGVVETSFDPGLVSEEVRGEVRKRIGQRIRELKNAVEILEERAHDD